MDHCVEPPRIPSLSTNVTQYCTPSLSNCCDLSEGIDILPIKPFKVNNGTQEQHFRSGKN